MRRTAFVWLPYWATDRRRRRAGAPPPETPLALVAMGAGGVRLAAVDARAVAEGLRIGQLMADARALTPNLVCQEHDLTADAAALHGMARWCGRFSPLTAPAQGASGTDGVFLEAAGVTHLFHDERGWLEALLGALAGLGFQARGAIADTPGAAWALARFAPQAAMIAPPGVGLEPLRALPVAALRLPEEMAGRLRALGLKRVDDLMRTPRASLARRFGRELIARLDQAGGSAGEPIDALSPAVRFIAAARFAEPLATQAALLAAAERLTQRLGAALARSGRGARRLRLTLERIDGAAAEITLGAARATNDPAAMQRLIAQRLETLAERLDLGFGVEGMRLAGLLTQPLTPIAVGLDPEAGAQSLGAAAVADLADRIAARLGEGAAARLRPHASHLPERAQARADRASPPAAFAPRSDRPLFLLAQPEPIEAVAEVPDGPPRRFRWRRVAHQVARADGPERIAAEWWRAPGQTRDYYRVETLEGRRFWLFREGLYGREDPPPRWFVCGSFA